MVASRMPWGDGVAMCWVLPLSVVDRGEPARVLAELRVVLNIFNYNFYS